MQLSLQENSIGMKRISNKQPCTTSAIIPSVMQSIRYITSWRKKEWIIHSQNSFLQAYASRIIVSNEELKLLKIRSKTASIPLKNTDHYQVPCHHRVLLGRILTTMRMVRNHHHQDQSLYNQESLVSRESGRSYGAHSNSRL